LRARWERKTVVAVALGNEKKLSFLSPSFSIFNYRYHVYRYNLIESSAFQHLTFSTHVGDFVVGNLVYIQYKLEIQKISTSNHGFKFNF